jgi:hypothetical protein
LIHLWVHSGFDEYILCRAERRYRAGLAVQWSRRGTIKPARGPSPFMLGIVAPDSMQRPMSPGRYGPSAKAVERAVAA